MSRYRYLLQREVGGARRRPPPNPLFARARRAAVFRRNFNRMRVFNFFARQYDPSNLFWVGNSLYRRTSFGTTRYLASGDMQIFG